MRDPERVGKRVGSVGAGGSRWSGACLPPGRDTSGSRVLARSCHRPFVHQSTALGEDPAVRHAATFSWFFLNVFKCLLELTLVAENLKHLLVLRLPWIVWSIVTRHCVTVPVHTLFTEVAECGVNSRG